MYSSDEDDFDVESSNSYHSLKRTVSLIAKVVPQLQSTQESSSSNQSNVSHWKREWKKRRVEIVAGVTGVLSGWLLKRQLLKQSTVLTTTSMCLLIFKVILDSFILIFNRCW